MSTEVAERLRFVRNKHGLSQRELAKRAGVTNGTISLIEQGRVSPSVGSLKKLLECIPMSLAEFFTFELVESRTVVSRRVATRCRTSATTRSRFTWSARA
ncbi:MerR family regulatory protein [Burkholderia lata]|nr:MerR family regulatory protein [Burkholderia lata]